MPSAHVFSQVDLQRVTAAAENAASAARVRVYEDLRLDIRKDYFDGKRSRRWTSEADFGNAIKASRQAVQRMLNKSYGKEGGPTREALEEAGFHLGLDIPKYLQTAFSTQGKCESIIRSVLPMVAARLETDIPPPSSIELTDFRERQAVIQFADSLGLPDPGDLTDADAYAAWVETVRRETGESNRKVTYFGCLWAGFRPLLEGFTSRLRKQLSSNKTENAEQLRRYLDLFKVVEKMVTPFWTEEASGLSDSQLSQIARKLSSLNGFDIGGRDGFLGWMAEHHLDFRIIRPGTPSAWMALHSPTVRKLANTVLTGG